MTDRRRTENSVKTRRGNPEKTSVANNGKTTKPGYKRGGVTGKGFLPGKSGNPTGRPKRLPVTDALRRRAESPVAEDVREAMKLPEGATWAEAWMVMTERQILKGNVMAFKEFVDRIEGKATQRLEVSGPNQAPITTLVDLSVLSPGEEKRLKELMAKVRRVPMRPSGPAREGNVRDE